jgi:acetyl esterase/lipase
VTFSRREFLRVGVAAGIVGTAAACGFFDDDGPDRIDYGQAGSQFGDLYVPSGDARGTVVLLHGGAWETEEDLSIVKPVAEDLRREGYVVWNVEYRRVGESGGGWPGTFDDVAAAIDHLAVLAEDRPVDLERVVIVGHSAGGTLALWAAGRDGSVRPRGFLSLAGLTDLASCVEEDLLVGACARVLGGTPAEVPDRYREASPAARLPTGRRQRLVHGIDDDIVPVRQSQDYVALAQAAGDPAEVVTVPNAGHFQLIDIQHPAYGEVLTQISQLLN